MANYTTIILHLSPTDKDLWSRLNDDINKNIDNRYIFTELLKDDYDWDDDDYSHIDILNMMEMYRLNIFSDYISIYYDNKYGFNGDVLICLSKKYKCDFYVLAWDEYYNCQRCDVYEYDYNKDKVLERFFDVSINDDELDMYINLKNRNRKLKKIIKKL